MKLSAVAILATTIAATGLIAADAKATTVSNCTVTGVSYDNGVRLIINCSATYYYGFAGTAYSGCVNTASVDTLKQWASQAQTAMLSGKTLTMNYDTQTGTCQNGAKTISLVWINN